MRARLYNPLFTRPDPNAGDFAAVLDSNSLEVLSDARLEPALAGDNADAPVQFERLGYFYRATRTLAPASWCSTARSAPRYLGEACRHELGCVLNCEGTVRQCKALARSLCHA
jgi:hypothetical protein